MPRPAWVTADTHFGHSEAVAMFGRQSLVAAGGGDCSTAAEVESMNQALIAKVNEVVGRKDRLFHLGDFTGPMPRKAQLALACEIRAQIHCQRIVLIRGNHDPRGERRFDRLFESVHDLLSFKLADDCRVVMTHYPLRVWQGQRDGSVHLYSHTHGTVEEIGRSTDVGVDCWQYAPLGMTDLAHTLCARPIVSQIEFDRKQPVRAPDYHHGRGSQ